jgi:isopentenyl phosphate kinase
MSNQETALVNREQQKAAKRAELSAIAKRIDETAAGAVDLFKGAGSFEKEIQLASAMRDLRELLTPEIMAPIMSLMN